MAKANPKAQWGSVLSRANHVEKYLRWFVDFCPVPIAMFDSNLDYVLVSQPWVKMLGIPRLKLIGTNLYESLPIAIAHRHGLERCLSGGQMHYTTKIEIAFRGESTHNFQWDVQPWYTDDGSVGGIIVSSHALAEQQTELLKSQLAEEIAERQYLEDAFTKIGTAIESANDAICITDGTGQPIYINLAFSDLFAYSLSALQKSTNLQPLFTDVQASKVIHSAVMHGGTWTSELEMLDRDHQRIPISLRVNPVKSPSGEVIGTTYICTNIRDRKAAEAEINKSFVALGATLEATADGILVLDAIGNIIICNQKFVDLWRIPDRIFRSHDDSHILKYVAKRISSAKYLQNFGKGLSTDQNSFEIVELDDGRTLECYSQPQNVLDSCAGRVWSLRDITERLAAEALVRASEEKYRLQAEKLEHALQELKSTQSQLIQAEKMSGLGQLVAGIAHEINNPVNFIYGNLSYADTYTSELLSLVETYRTHYPEPIEAVQTKLEEIDIDFLASDFVKLVGSIRIGAERIQKIVQSLNKFSRSDEEGCKYVDIHEGIDSTLMILQSRLKATAHRPEIQIEKKYASLPEVECYAGQLNQVFMNLLTNAIDALEDDAQANGFWQIVNEKPLWTRKDGKVSKILIQTEILADSQNSDQLCDRLVIKISDNGNGIPDELRNRLFDLFFTTKPVGKGTGLGLSIAYQIITENHGGKLSFSSEVGKGTEFTIEIPLNQTQR
ncbi:ATP-binding protein [Phormidium tenue]|jgi:PAS domain S-box-containing protein|uniref:histidine kinase n=1 Tax=Phormidium tenue FACHB-1050 TaxID=2692857 RepID=A0ABR8C4Q2_9CYAN|nr:ATP-binding protein [Phormidium tenue]MBD2315457.1 PAS domain-containing protein [Phormidium tenue FACHB-1050]